MNSSISLLLSCNQLTGRTPIESPVNGFHSQIILQVDQRTHFETFWLWTVKRSSGQWILQNSRYFNRIASEVDESRVPHRIYIHNQKWCGTVFLYLPEIVLVVHWVCSTNTKCAFVEHLYRLENTWDVLFSACLYYFKCFYFQWSFGVLLWEIYTFADLPYAGVSNLALYSHLKGKNHLTKPLMLQNDELYELVYVKTVHASVSYAVNLYCFLLLFPVWQIWTDAGMLGLGSNWKTFIHCIENQAQWSSW